MTSTHPRPPRLAVIRRVSTMRRERAFRRGVEVRVDFLWYCEKCSRPAVKGKPFLPKHQIETWQKLGKLKNLDDIPTINDYSKTVTCEVCGKSGAEWHHWLPQVFAELVKNFMDWPTGYLCKGCHDEWHEIVTWYLPGRGATELSKAAQDKVKGKRANNGEHSNSNNRQQGGVR